MDKKKKIIIVSCIAAVIIVAACVWGMNMKKTENRDMVSDTGTVQQTENVQSEEAEQKDVKTEEKSDAQKTGDKQTAKSEPEKVYTPTFMYFVSGSDEGFENTNKVIEELKKEYDGKVTFDVRNIDEDKEAAENFPVEGNTPLLIMLNTKNDMSAFNPKCSDKDMLKQAIEIALGAEQ